MAKLYTHTCNFHQELDIANNFHPVENIGGVKPRGGFWLSINEGWEHWCESEMPNWLEGTRYQAKLKPSVNIYWIWTNEDLDKLPSFEGTPSLDAYCRQDRKSVV